MFKKVIVFFVAFIMLFTVVYANQYSNEDENLIAYEKKSYAKIKVVDSESREIIKDVIINLNPTKNKFKSLKIEYKGQDLTVDNLEIGTYDWIVKAKDYKISKFYNYPIVSGGNIYVLELSKENSINKDYFEVIEKRKKAGQCNFDDGHPELNKESNHEISENASDFSTRSVPQDPPTVPSDISVKYNGTVYPYVELEDYVAHVICREMDPNYYIYDSMSDAQKLVALKAQAVTARTYAIYRCYVWTGRHTDCDVCDDVHCQVYDPVYTPQLAVDAANQTEKQILIKVTDFYNWIWQYPDTVFSASCLGETINSEDSPSFGNYCSYLRGVSCPYDIRPTLDLGHNVGLCQDGAAGYALNGYSYTYILNHYFTGLTLRTGQN